MTSIFKNGVIKLAFLTGLGLGVDVSKSFNHSTSLSLGLQYERNEYYLAFGHVIPDEFSYGYILRSTYSYLSIPVRVRGSILVSRNKNELRLVFSGGLDAGLILWDKYQHDLSFKYQNDNTCCFSFIEDYSWHPNNRFLAGISAEIGLLHINNFLPVEIDVGITYFLTNNWIYTNNSYYIGKLSDNSTYGDQTDITAIPRLFNYHFILRFPIKIRTQEKSPIDD